MSNFEGFGRAQRDFEGIPWRAVDLAQDAGVVEVVGDRLSETEVFLDAQ